MYKFYKVQYSDGDAGMSMTFGVSIKYELYKIVRCRFLFWHYNKEVLLATTHPSILKKVLGDNYTSENVKEFLISNQLKQNSHEHKNN